MYIYSFSYAQFNIFDYISNSWPLCKIEKQNFRMKTILKLLISVNIYKASFIGIPLSARDTWTHRKKFMPSWNFYSSGKRQTKNKYVCFLKKDKCYGKKKKKPEGSNGTAWGKRSILK